MRVSKWWENYHFKFHSLTARQQLSRLFSSMEKDDSSNRHENSIMSPGLQKEQHLCNQILLRIYFEKSITILFRRRFSREKKMQPPHVAPCQKMIHMMPGCSMPKKAFLRVYPLLQNHFIAIAFVSCTVLGKENKLPYSRGNSVTYAVGERVCHGLNNACDHLD